MAGRSISIWSLLPEGEPASTAARETRIRPAKPKCPIPRAICAFISRDGFGGEKYSRLSNTNKEG